MQESMHGRAAMQVPGRARPAFFNLLQIGLPVTAVVSFAHRVSGVVLALLVPVLACMLQRSLSGPEGFDQLAALFARLDVRLVMILAIWALAHHVLAGVRHLLFDIHVGTGLRAARASAWIVFILEAAIVLLAIGVAA